jgi:hypothetical protein
MCSACSKYPGNWEGVHAEERTQCEVTACMTCTALGFGKRHDGSDDANMHNNKMCPFNKKNKAFFLESIKRKMNHQNKSLKFTGSSGPPIPFTQDEIDLEAAFVNSIHEDSE